MYLCFGCYDKTCKALMTCMRYDELTPTIKLKLIELHYYPYAINITTCRFSVPEKLNVKGTQKHIFKKEYIYVYIYFYTQHASLTSDMSFCISTL